MKAVIHTVIGITLVIALLKVTGNVDMTWWEVLFPLWCPAAIYLAMLLYFIIFKNNYMSRSQGHVQLRTTADREFYTRTVAENGRTLSSSETFGDRTSAINNIKAELNLYGGDKVEVREYDSHEQVVRTFKLNEDGGIEDENTDIPQSPGSGTITTESGSTTASSNFQTPKHQ